jgi:hypothetical protein
MKYLPRELPFRYEGSRFTIVASLKMTFGEGDNHEWEYIRGRWLNLDAQYGVRYLVRTTWPWPCYDPSTGTYYYVVSEVLDRIAP